MKQRLLALADKLFRDGNRAGAIEAIDAFYALVDTEQRADRLLREHETVTASESSRTFEKKSHGVVLDLGHCSASAPN